MDYNECDKKVFDTGLVLPKADAMKYLEHCITIELQQNFYEAEFTVEESLPAVKELMEYYETLRDCADETQVKFRERIMSPSSITMEIG